MMAKQEIGFVALNTDHDIIVVDPEREYGPLIRAPGRRGHYHFRLQWQLCQCPDISAEYGDGRNRWC